mmetsp:Transcript_6339/g.26265  ORF Transcript_6339/g.26265 Transcript_6339/m.26265 type:complete len:211 (+) Transcript_6339:153-785(+)
MAAITADAMMEKAPPRRNEGATDRGLGTCTLMLSLVSHPSFQPGGQGVRRRMSAAPRSFASKSVYSATMISFPFSLDKLRPDSSSSSSSSSSSITTTPIRPASSSASGARSYIASHVSTFFNSRSNLVSRSACPRAAPSPLSWTFCLAVSTSVVNRIVGVRSLRISPGPPYDLSFLITSRMGTVNRNVLGLSLFTNCGSRSEYSSGGSCR